MLEICQAIIYSLQQGNSRFDILNRVDHRPFELFRMPQNIDR